MAYRDWASTLGEFVISFLIYQGVLWNVLHRTQAIAPLDDEDYISGKGRIARSSASSCRSGWEEFGDKCYKVFGNDDNSRGKSWSSASNHCRKLLSTLASIHSRQEQDYLRTKFYPRSRGLWIGLHRTNRGRSFLWEDGSPMDFTEWNGGEPNSRSRFQACVIMGSSPEGMWSDELCSTSQRFICQRSKDLTENLLEQSSGDGEELCTGEICQNGGTCVERRDAGNFQCICSSGFKGQRCEEGTLCAYAVCENGGSCLEDYETGSIQCLCADGYSGQKCEEKDSVPGFDIYEYIYIIGGVTVVVSLIVIIIAVVLIKRSRRRGKNSKDSVATPTEYQSVSMSSCKRTSGQD